LADAPWLVPPAGALSTPRPAAVVYEGSDLPSPLDLVAADHGAALLPARACTDVDGIVGIPVRDPPLVHRTELLTLRTLSPRQHTSPEPEPQGRGVVASVRRAARAG
jgi:hypothetical protein